MPSPSYLCVGGAGTRAPCYVGLVEAMEDSFQIGFGVPFAEWTADLKGCGGTSAGAVVALGILLGMGAKEMRDVFSTALDDVRQVFPNVSVTGLMERYGLDTGVEARRLISCLIEKAGLCAETTTFARLHSLTKKEFACTATNVSKREGVVLSRHTVPDMLVGEAVFVSMCVPFLFVPVRVGGDMMVDGCLRDADFCCGFDPNQTMRWWVDASPTGEVSTWKEYLFAVLESATCSPPPLSSSLDRLDVAVVVDGSTSAVDFFGTGGGGGGSREELERAGYAAGTERLVERGWGRTMGGVVGEVVRALVGERLEEG